MVGLVIAPILGNGKASNEAKRAACCGPKKEMCKETCNGKTSYSCEKGAACYPGKGMMGKCDMNECAKMSKEECAKMCDEKGCSAEEKAACMSHFDKNGKWMGGNIKQDCCKQ